jgi:hypothetical protein
MPEKEHTPFAPTQLLRNSRQQQPSNQGDTDSCVTRKVEAVHSSGLGEGDTAYDFIFVTLYVTAFLS